MNLSLALIGQNIGHSKSELMYKKILKTNFTYTLLDYGSEDDIPNLLELSKLFTGVSITAPYKKHFIRDVILDEKTKRIGAINCLKFKDEKFYGFNTDFLAIEEMIINMEYLKKDIIVFGDGAMAKVLSIVLESYAKEFTLLSRKANADISNYDLEKISSTNLLVINCCARGFEFKGAISKESVFWDLNYSHTFHKNTIPNKCTYIDGEELLFRQALHATKLWGLE